jgi:GNAT superfamily N-acetyltransferase
VGIVLRVSESSVREATAEDIPALLPLVRAYTDFYESEPSDEGLVAMCESLIADPEVEGVLFCGCDGDGEIAGFAVLSWKWSSLRGARIGFLDDLFVHPDARGSGLAEKLIAACGDRARRRGATALEWLTAPDNKRAQAVYDRVGGVSEPLIEYSLDL